MSTKYLKIKPSEDFSRKYEIRNFEIEYVSLFSRKKEMQVFIKVNSFNADSEIQDLRQLLYKNFESEGLKLRMKMDINSELIKKDVVGFIKFAIESYKCESQRYQYIFASYEVESLEDTIFIKLPSHHLIEEAKRVEIKDRLTQRIHDCVDTLIKIEFVNGDFKEIKEIYNVSSTTAVRVLNELETAGYIFRIQGKGSFVNKTLVNKKVYVTENNNFHKHFKESVSEHSDVIEAEIIQDKELCAKLKIKNQKLLKVVRIKYIGNVSWAHQTNYIPLKYLPDINIADIDGFKELATMIRKKYRIDIHQEKSKKYMKVIVDPPKKVADFIAKEGEPCFEFDRYTYFSDENIFEYVKIYINYKYYSLTIKD